MSKHSTPLHRTKTYTLYNIQCIVYIIHCTHYTLYSVHCEIQYYAYIHPTKYYPTNRTKHYTRYTLYPTRCGGLGEVLYYVQCTYTMYSGQCIMSTVNIVHCTLYTVHVLLYSIILLFPDHYSDHYIASGMVGHLRSRVQR